MGEQSHESKLAFFPGSFDPFTYGHMDVVEQALELFDKVIVGIGVSSAKVSLLTVDERAQAIKDLYIDNSQVQVEPFEGLAVDFARKIGATVLVRGLRNESDFAYEMPMAMTNRKLNNGLHTVFFLTKTDFAYVSSSLVKELYVNHADVSQFVPPEVLAQLKKKFGRTS